MRLSLEYVHYLIALRNFVVAILQLDYGKRNGKTGRGSFFLALIGLFPLAVLVADPLFTVPYETRFKIPVLLVFPERVEVRWIGNISEVSPSPQGADYTFAIPPSRQKWVEQQLRVLPPPRPGSAWKLHVRQLSSNTQRIDLEAYRGGFSGLIYDAHENQIVPIAYRAAGPAAAFVFLGIDIGLSGALSLVVLMVLRFFRLRRNGA